MLVTTEVSTAIDVSRGLKMQIHSRFSSAYSNELDIAIERGSNLLDTSVEGEYYSADFLVEGVSKMLQSIVEGYSNLAAFLLEGGSNILEIFVEGSESQKGEVERMRQNILGCTGG